MGERIFVDILWIFVTATSSCRLTSLLEWDLGVLRVATQVPGTRYLVHTRYDYLVLYQVHVVRYYCRKEIKIGRYVLSLSWQQHTKDKYWYLVLSTTPII